MLLCTPAVYPQVAQAEGLAGFNRGFGAVLSGGVPATALYFGGDESGKRMLPPGSGMLGDMLVGCYTQAIAGIVFTPVDVIKERMQVRYCPHLSTLKVGTAVSLHNHCVSHQESWLYAELSLLRGSNAGGLP